jgi:hypothetical protein
MRILTLSVPEFLFFIPECPRPSKVKKLFLYVLLFEFIFASNELIAQWVNNPAENTRVVFDLSEPINISSVDDQNGGAFIFWEDNITGLQNEIRFMHIDSNGDISFKADGKRISEKTGDQDNPVAVSAGKNSAVAVWKDYSINRTGDLLVQKVQTNGSIQWNPQGVKINSFKKEISDYSLCANEKGEVFISYLGKEPGQVFNSRLMLQKISPSGKFLFDSSGINVSASVNGKLIPLVIPDDSDGVYVFWIESPGGKGNIFSQHYNNTGKSLWGKKPLAVTDNTLNVITFSAIKAGADIYIAYQVLRRNKSIYHQLINADGKMLWGKNGRICSDNKGIQSNPQMISSSADLILSWTNEINNDRDIYIQKYDRSGKSLWKEGGLPVIKMNGDQFGQKLISDDHNGAIVAWLDRRTASVSGNIYSQRISTDGNMMWEGTGIAIGSFFNTPKSYLNLLPDGRGSAIAVFKEKRNSENGIYVQKIFNSGTFVSQIIGFSAGIISDSVKISWYSANETPQSFYNIERCAQTDSGNTDWRKLITVNSDSSRPANFYEYYDKPGTSGTLYYRVILTDKLGNMQSSVISRVTFLESTDYIIVTQNNPNPFSDSTIIKFYLPEEANVKIEFFDNHIEKINEINNRFPAGENSITFSAFNRQPGIYFYKFECGDFVEVKKMVLTN